MVIAERRDIREVASDCLACKDPNRRAYLVAEFMESSDPLIISVVRGKVPYDDYEEVVAYSRLAVYKGIMSGKLKYADKADAWVYTIAANTKKSYYRRNGAHRVVSLETAEELHSEGYGNPEEELERQFRYDALHRAIDELTPRQREFMQYSLQDLSPKEISDISGEAVGVIKLRKHRALKSLREKLLPVLQ